MGRLVSILALVLAGTACLPVGAQAAFGVNDFDVTFAGADGSPVSQAGSHPFEMTTSLAMNLSGEEPEGRLQELFIDEMPGLLTNPTAVPRCSDEDFETLNEGVNDCPNATAVGIFQGAFGDPDGWTSSPVFNLVPPSGVLMRLGFRLADAANVIVDFELSPEPPYRLLATVGEIPETSELFAAKLQMWGVPADPHHDSLRGNCLGPDGGSLGLCQIGIGEAPLLTLPSTCEGAQASYYEVLSWEGGEDFGSALTHDDADNPMGFTGCGALAFDPVAIVRPTTDAAQSATGLDFSLQMSDDGLGNPRGVAESQIRNAAVALPGMGIGPGMSSSSGGCSEVDVEAETPDSVPGEGCPATSAIGTAEVESPLVEGHVIHGAIYRATPHENLAGDAAAALYMVLKDSGPSVSIVQPVALEADAATGELIAIAEDLPQLPFSDLRLHLDDGKGGPLVSPPLCGKYETEADFDPWAGGGTLRAFSSFQISSGPSGGPCPPGAHEDHSAPGPPSGSSPPAANVPSVLSPLVPHKHSCLKGRHRVRRHGKARCVTGRHRKHRVRAH